jgi:hypothetical protein
MDGAIKTLRQAQRSQARIGFKSGLEVDFSLTLKIGLKILINYFLRLRPSSPNAS